MSRDSLAGMESGAQLSTRQRVEQIFEGTGPFYDEIVDLATSGEDRRWKEELVGLLGRPRRVLDLACGTGILTFMIRDLFPATEVVGVDITLSLLRVAQERATTRRDSLVRFCLGAAEEVDLPDPFDAVVSCYLPKYADLPRLVSRISLALSPGGVLAMQDFVYPDSDVVRRAWHRRFEGLRSWAAAQRPEARGMFELLPDVIRESDWLTRLPLLLHVAGFEEIRVTRQTLGTSAIVFGRKPGGIGSEEDSRQ